MPKNEISFSQNWNGKLICDVFTTFRMRSAKYQIGERYRVMLKGSFLKDVELLDVFHCTLRENDLPVFFCELDTGYGKNEFIEMVRTMYKNGNVNFETQQWSFLLLKTIKK